RGDDEAEQETDPRRDALGVLLGHLGIVVGKADQPEGQRHQQHDPDIGNVEPRPEKGGDQERRQDQQAAHGGRAGLGEMALRAVVADRLALALLPAPKVDQRAPEQEAEDQRSGEGPAGAEGDVAKKVEEPAVISETRKPVQHHSVPSAGAAFWPSLRSPSTTRLTFDPFEPFTRTMSPASNS